MNMNHMNNNGGMIPGNPIHNMMTGNPGNPMMQYPNQQNQMMQYPNQQNYLYQNKGGEGTRLDGGGNGSYGNGSHGNGSHGNVQSSDSESNYQRSEYSGIQELAADVNNSLDALDDIESSRSKKRYTESDEDSEEEVEEPEKLKQVTELESNYGKLLVEPLILLTLYVILSQPFVVSLFSTYITHLNPTDDGSISMSGILIYGLILTLLFVVTRHIVISKF